MAAQIRVLASASTRYRDAEANRDLIDAAIAAGRRAENQVRDAARAAAEAEARARTEWHIRQNNALAAIEAKTSYHLPAGFGEMHHDRRQYPMGRDGQVVRLGDTRLSDFDGVARRVAEGYLPSPAGEAHVDALRADLRSPGASSGW